MSWNRPKWEEASQDTTVERSRLIERRKGSIRCVLCPKCGCYGPINTKCDCTPTPPRIQ